MRSQPTLSLSLSLSPRNGPVTRVEGRLGGRSVAHVVLGSDRVDDVPGRQAVALRDPSLSSSAICFFFYKKKNFFKESVFSKKKPDPFHSFLRFGSSLQICVDFHFSFVCCRPVPATSRFF